MSSKTLKYLHHVCLGKVRTQSQSNIAECKWCGRGLAWKRFPRRIESAHFPSSLFFFTVCLYFSLPFPKRMEARSCLLGSFIHSYHSIEIEIKLRLVWEKERENKIAQQQPQQCFNRRIEKEYKRWSKWNLEDLLFHHKPSPIFIETLHFPFLFSFSHLFNLLVCFPTFQSYTILLPLPPLTTFFNLHLNYIPHC